MVARLVQKKLTELGRIRIGDRVPSASGKSTRPHKLLQFRLTSPNRSLLQFAAASYGGNVRPWESESAPRDEHGRPTQYELYTAVNAMDVLIPTMSALSLNYELWSASGCQRRCTGEVITHCPLNERLIDTVCCCPEDDQERQALATQGKACARILRLNVLLPDLPGMGTWRLETKGYYATAELLGTLDMLRLGGQEHQIIEAVLRLEQRSVKRPGNGQGTGTLTFAVPVLWPKWSPRQLLASAAQHGHVLMSAPPQIEATKSLQEHIADLYPDGIDPTAPQPTPPAPLESAPDTDTSPTADVAALVAHIDAVMTDKGLTSQQRTQWRGRMARRNNVKRFTDIPQYALQGILTTLEARAAALEDPPTPEATPEPEPLPDEPEPPTPLSDDDFPPMEDIPNAVPAEPEPTPAPTIPQDLDHMALREAIVELTPHAVDRWKAEDALAVAENADATAEDLTTALHTLQSAIDRQQTTGDPDDEPSPHA